MEVWLEPCRRLARPVNRDDYMEAFLRVVDREPIMRAYGFLEASLRNGQSRARISEQLGSDVS